MADQPAAKELRTPTNNHGRGVYVAAALIAIVGAIGLVLIIVMSYLLLTTESGPAPAADPTPIAEETPRLEELPEIVSE